MDEQRLERALHQGPPFATGYVPHSLALDAQPVVRGPVSVGRLVLIVAVTALLLVGMLAGLAALGWGPTPPEEPSVDLGIFEPVAGRIVYGDATRHLGSRPQPRRRIPDEGPADLRGRHPAGVVERRHPAPHRARRQSVRAGRRRVAEAGYRAADAERKRHPLSRRVAHRVRDRERALRRRRRRRPYRNAPPPATLRFREADLLSQTGLRSRTSRGQGRSRPQRVADGRRWQRRPPDPGQRHDPRGGHVRGLLAWSPAGDRIALSLEESIYTFAPDGSGFTRLIDGVSPYWSPDGSQIAYLSGFHQFINGSPRDRRCGRLQRADVRLRCFGAVASGLGRGWCRRVMRAVWGSNPRHED